jgi:16S rRNA (adenine1518-N6/adenine1519-N6)-dimethyltransferase
MVKVHPKKNLGQHFLRDREIAHKVAMSLTGTRYNSVLEIGPGTGILTEFLLKRNFTDFKVIEIDNESVNYLKGRFPGLEIITGDILAMDIGSYFYGKLGIAGNFPYNISSQILFKALENKDKIVEVCGMFQKEVAERICASPGSKIYGILSILLQAFYTTEYLFTVPEHVFYPPPRVKSGVVRLLRNDVTNLGCDEGLFTKVVKSGFNQRRKKLRNSIRSAFDLQREDCEYFDLRPEQLSVEMFVDLTVWIGKNSLSTRKSIR